MSPQALPKLVGRDEQRQLIADVLDSLADLPAWSPPLLALEFYGIPGLGKSRLLEEAKSLCRQRSLPFALIDFHPERHGTESTDPYSFLLRLCDQLDHYLPAIFIARAVIAAAARRLGEEQPADAVIKSFAERLADCLDRQPLIVLLDDTENCSDNVLTWLGAVLLPALLETGRIHVVVIAGGRSPRLARWDLRAPTLRSFRLNPLDFQATQAHVSQIALGGSAPATAQEIYALSSGHPYSTEAIIKWLSLLGGGAAKPEPMSPTILAQRLYDEVIRRYILRDSPDSLMALIEVASVLRRFDAAMLRRLLDRYRPELTKDKEIQWFILRLSELLSLPLHVIYLGEGSPAYELDVTLRRLLHTALAILHTEELIELHETALDILTQLGSSEPQLDTALLVERLYHKAQAEVLRGRELGSALRAMLRTSLVSSFGPRNSLYQMKLHELNDRLSHDVELAELIGAELIQPLRDMIDSALQPSAGPTPLATHHIIISYQHPSDYTVTWYRQDQRTFAQRRVQSGLQPGLREWRNNPERIGRAAFRSYLPTAAQTFVSNAHVAGLLIRTDHVEMPWELLHDGKDFLCLRSPVARQPIQIEEVIDQAYDTSRPPRALVVGNPTGDLPDSAREAEAVAALLREAGVTVDLLVGPEQARYSEFVVKLTNEYYHLIHYAGHGYFDLQPPVQGGLHFHGAEMLGEEIQRCLSSPVFLYLSACDVGQAVGQDSTLGLHGRFMEGVAVKALLGGAIGCMGPIWPIEDSVALEFALTFYREAVNTGLPISEAVRRARVSIRDRSPDFWASWVLYGDLNTRLFEAF